MAALTGGVVSTAVNIPAIGAEDMEMLGPFLPLATKLGRLAMELAEGSSVERIEAAFLGRIADFDTRLLGLAVIVGALEGRTEEQVNLVNAPTMAHQRGIVLEEKVGLRGPGLQRADPRDGRGGRRARGGRRNRASAPTACRTSSRCRAGASRSSSSRYVTVFRYEDLPGMIGRVGTIFGAHGINISSAAVGHTPDGGDEGRGQRLAAMVVTTDAPCPPT